MNKTKTKNTVAIVYYGSKIIGYLTSKHEEQGIDIQLDLQGYTIVSI